VLKLALVVLLAAAAVVVWPRAEERRSDRLPARATPAPEPPRPPAARLPTARCARGVAGCASARGRIVFVERVDADGDGDLHVVIAGGGVTAPGLSAVDVSAALRPRRDPRVGDRASAAGPVQRGTYGQSQIHALEFHARRR
jgi:hypothetical protein